MRRRLSDLLVVTVLVVAALALILLGPRNVALRAAFALPLVLVLPGYALTAAAFPTGLRGEERLVFSLGLSLAFTALAAFVLDLLPGGLRTESWAALLGATTLAGGGVARVRRRNSSVASGRAGLGLIPRQGLLLALAALTIATAVGVAGYAVANQPQAGFTQLWLVEGAGADGRSARLGVRSLELGPTSYTLRIVVQGAIVEEIPLQLQPGETWDGSVALPEAGAETVEARLYRAAAPEEIYRRVALWLGG